MARIALVAGFSLEAQQPFEWARSFPEIVERSVPICGSGRVSAHKRVLLDGAVATLEAAGPATLRASGRPEDYLKRSSMSGYGTTFAREPRDVRTMFATWRAADISWREQFASDFFAALESIRAQTIAMPSRSDLSFPPDDSRGRRRKELCG